MSNICSAEKLTLSVFWGVISSRSTPGMNTSCSPTSGLICTEVPNSAAATNESTKIKPNGKLLAGKPKNLTRGRSLRSNNS